MTPAPAGYVGAAETHSGAVLFLGDLAYKVKKPVDLGFVDWRRLDDRRRACRREIELNRRIAPDVYLGLGELRAPDGTAEPAVVMRRLPDDRRLATLVLDGEDVDTALRDVAHRIAAFHLAAPPTPLAAECAGLTATLERWHVNHDRMKPLLGRWLDGDTAAAVLDRADRYLGGRAPLLARRIAAGWARDGHGDLLADDIFCLADGCRILDCLDFDERLRSGDVLADVAFLAMDLERLGRPDLGARLLALHRDLTGDSWPASLADHYVAYRAQVRALVSGLRAAQGDDVAGRMARVHLDLARRRLEAGAVRLVLIGGPPGSGKSTLAAGLGAELGAVVLRSDEVRKELAGIPVSARAAGEPGTGIYSPDWTERTYATLFERAARLLGLGESVVVDASFTADRFRERGRAVARSTSSDLAELRCSLPVDVAAMRAERRLAAGGDASDAGAIVATELAAAADPWPEAVAVDTSHDPGLSLAAARRALCI